MTKMAEPRRRRIKWTDRSFIAYGAQVGVFVLGAIMLSMLFHTRLVWGLMLPEALVIPGFAFGSALLQPHLEHSAAPAGQYSHDLASAWAANWGLVLVHSIRWSLILSFVYAASPGVGPRQALIGAAIFMIPMFLCALIIDIGGAFGVPGRS